MTRIDGPSPLPRTPVAGAPAPAPQAPAAQPRSVAEPPLAPAQLGALDAMMQAFLADGQLSQAELQAYQAARASFTQGGWEGVPLPEDDEDDVAVLQAQAASYEAQAQQALGGAARGVPAAAPAGAARGVPAAAPAGGAAPAAAANGVQPAQDGLPGALAAYRKAILDHDKQAQGYMAQVFSGLTSGPDSPVHFLPGLMIPAGVRVLTQAALNREPTADEMDRFRQMMQDPNGMVAVMDAIMAQAPDRAAVAARLKWSAIPPIQPTAEDLARQQEFNNVMQRLANQQPAAPAPRPAPAPAPAAPRPAPPPVDIKPEDYSALRARAVAAIGAGGDKGRAYMVMDRIDTRNALAKEAASAAPFDQGRHNGDGQSWGDRAVVAGHAFIWADRPNPGLLGGWDSPPIGKTYVTADPTLPWGGYNDIHYWPDTQDPGYKALWELIFAANNGDKAAWTELMKMKIVLGDNNYLHFIESRPGFLAMPGAGNNASEAEHALQDGAAKLALAARDRWKAGQTQVVLANDPDYATRIKAQVGEILGVLDQGIQQAAAYFPG